MKKYILLAFVTLLTWSAATAQKWYITPQIGINLSDLQGGDQYAHFKTTTGFVGGVEVENRLNHLLGISLGVFYSEKGCNPNIITTLLDRAGDVKYLDAHIHTTKVKLRYLSFPLICNFHLWKGLTLKGGIQYSLNFSAREKFQNEGYGSLLEFGKIYSFDESTTRYYKGTKPDAPTSDNMPNAQILDDHYSKGLKSFIHAADIAIPLGASYEYKNIILDVRYQIGLSKVFRQDSKFENSLMVKKKDNIRNACTSITIGYRFGL